MYIYFKSDFLVKLAILQGQEKQHSRLLVMFSLDSVEISRLQKVKLTPSIISSLSYTISY